MKISHKVGTYISAAALLGLSNLAVANYQDQNIEVDVDTSDKVLLEGKNTDRMFKVLTPSARLTLHIEGVSHDINMSSENGMTVLHVQDVSEKEADAIRKTYSEISNSDNFEVKTSYSDRYSTNKRANDNMRSNDTMSKDSAMQKGDTVRKSN